MRMATKSFFPTTSQNSDKAIYAGNFVSCVVYVVLVYLVCMDGSPNDDILDLIKLFCMLSDSDVPYQAGHRQYRNHDRTNHTIPEWKRAEKVVVAQDFHFRVCMRS